jgi:hypothetical protein
LTQTASRIPILSLLALDRLEKIADRLYQEPLNYSVMQ